VLSPSFSPACLVLLALCRSLAQIKSRPGCCAGAPTSAYIGDRRVSFEAGVPPATASAIAKQEADGTLSVWVPDGAAGYTAEDSPFLGATTEQNRAFSLSGSEKRMMRQDHLPRQAWDKHREGELNDRPFRTALEGGSHSAEDMLGAMRSEQALSRWLTRLLG